MCKYCKELNEEKEKIRIEEIYISNAGYYNYDMPLRHCPVCGKILNKYKDLSKEQIKYGTYQHQSGIL